MTWISIDDAVGLWSAEYKVPMMKSRSTAVRLSSGGFLVFSPGGGLEREFRDQIGTAEILLAPNSYHHLGLAAWREEFPSAVATVREGALARLKKQGVSDLASLDIVRSALPDAVSLLEPPGTRIGESWLRVALPSGVAWAVGDAFFNIPELARRFRPRLVQRVFKAAPGLAMSKLMKWGGLKDRRGFKEWILHQIEADQPQTLIPLHGDILTSEQLPERLVKLVDERL